MDPEAIAEQAREDARSGNYGSTGADACAQVGGKVGYTEAFDAERRRMQENADAAKRFYEGNSR